MSDKLDDDDGRGAAKPPPSPDYDVGYGKPPKKTRYRRGQSGNPSGRPKTVKSLEEYVVAELGAKLTVRKNGRAERITLRQYIATSLVQAAAKGDHRARKLVLDTDAREQARKAEAQNSSSSELAADAQVYKAIMMSLSTGGVGDAGPSEGKP